MLYTTFDAAPESEPCSPCSRVSNIISACSALDFVQDTVADRAESGHGNFVLGSLARKLHSPLCPLFFDTAAQTTSHDTDLPALRTRRSHDIIRGIS